METKSHELMNGWTIITHPSYKIYTNHNAYVLLDNDGDSVMRFAVQENEIEVFSSNWNLNYKLNLGFKTLKIKNHPDVNES
jgi:hypothetical protein